jgi:hypothetical protein
MLLTPFVVLLGWAWETLVNGLMLELAIMVAVFWR